MIRIVADDKIPFLKGALEGVAQVDYLPGGAITHKDVKEAEVLITRTRTICNQKLLEGSNVQFIASATIGYDHIDTAYCKEAGIKWTNAPGCNSASVRQYIVSSLIYLIKKRKLNPRSLTLGVIGIGNVGSKVVHAGTSLGMKVLKNDPPRQRMEGHHDFIDLDKLLEASDVVTVHVPLNKGGEDNTLRMVDQSFISRMKKGAVLINTSRGGVVDENALLSGIQEGRFSDIILDVFANEPDINLDLLKAITLGTPHIAGYSLDGKANGTTMSVRAISRYFNLGLDQWEPDSIPAPAKPELLADTSNGEHMDLLWELFRQSYDVTVDDRRLRDHPELFERLRGDYPFRREPEAYSVRMFQGYKEITTQLENLGFSVLSDYCT